MMRAVFIISKERDRARGFKRQREKEGRRERNRETEKIKKDQDKTRTRTSGERIDSFVDMQIDINQRKPEIEREREIELT